MAAFLHFHSRLAEIERTWIPSRELGWVQTRSAATAVHTCLPCEPTVKVSDFESFVTEVAATDWGEQVFSAKVEMSWACGMRTG